MFGVYSRLGYDKREPTPCSKKTTHKRRSLVNFRGHGFLPEKHVWKINKMPEFYVISSAGLTMVQVVHLNRGL